MDPCNNRQIYSIRTKMPTDNLKWYANKFMIANIIREISLTILINRWKPLLLFNLQIQLEGGRVKSDIMQKLVLIIGISTRCSTLGHLLILNIIHLNILNNTLQGLDQMGINHTLSTLIFNLGRQTHPPLNIIITSLYNKTRPRSIDCRPFREKNSRKNSKHSY